MADNIHPPPGGWVNAGFCPRCYSLLAADEESIVCSDLDCEWRPTELSEDWDVPGDIPRL